MKKAEFFAEIKPQPGMNAAFIEFPYNPIDYFESDGRIKIKATFDEKVIYRGLLVKMDKAGCHLVGLNQDIRTQIGKKAGDTVKVLLEKDVEERIVEIPENFQKILSSNKLYDDFFQKLSFTNKKEYVRWVTEPKKEETRLARLSKIPQLLEKKIKTPYSK